jgi:hypothetical protein
MIHAAKIDWVETEYFDGNDQLIFQDDSGNAIATFELPAGLLRAFINDKAASSVWARPDGLIYSVVDDPDAELDAPLAIDDLVARDVAPDMLEDEPNVKSALLLFEQRLKRSLELVEAAIKRLEAPDI